MALDPNLVWAFISVGRTFFLWGADKLLELAKDSQLSRAFKIALSVFMFGAGAYIIFAALGLL